jgi:hypothetical protein
VCCYAAGGTSTCTLPQNCATLSGCCRDADDCGGDQTLACCRSTLDGGAGTTVSCVSSLAACCTNPPCTGGTNQLAVCFSGSDAGGCRQFGPCSTGNLFSPTYPDFFRCS